MPDSRESAVNHAHPYQAIESWVDPAIEGDIRRALIRGRMRSIAAKDLADGSPSLSAQFLIVAPAVDILRYEIADDAADHDV
ncbi:MAG TPA: hypothetical protein VEZ90_08365 [Blastocatellia bacterium]|nr:hypothetical protein [Blastocatellia bacterium]